MEGVSSNLQSKMVITSLKLQVKSSKQKVDNLTHELNNLKEQLAEREANLQKKSFSTKEYEEKIDAQAKLIASKDTLFDRLCLESKQFNDENEKLSTNINQLTEEKEQIFKKNRNLEDTIKSIKHQLSVVINERNELQKMRDEESSVDLNRELYKIIDNLTEDRNHYKELFQNKSNSDENKLENKERKILHNKIDKLNEELKAVHKSKEVFSHINSESSVNHDPNHEIGELKEKLSISEMFKTKLGLKLSACHDEKTRLQKLLSQIQKQANALISSEDNFRKLLKERDFQLEKASLLNLQSRISQKSTISRDYSSKTSQTDFFDSSDDVLKRINKGTSISVSKNDFLVLRKKIITLAVQEARRRQESELDELKKILSRKDQEIVYLKSFKHTKLVN